MRSGIRCALWTAALSVLGGISCGAAAAPPAPGASARVERFSPRGPVKQVRQVTARFSAPMVALGDPRLADPFAVVCAIPGKGRWADERNWVYDFDAGLPAGLRCRFTLKKGLAALDGTPLGGPASFVFDTGGPAIQASFPPEGWQELDEEQVFLLRLDAPATAASVHAHAWCLIEGLAERVPVQVLTGAARRAVLEQRRELGYGYEQLLRDGDTPDGARAPAPARGVRSEENIVALRCERRLPPSTAVQLVWGEGIAAASGLATREAQRLAFKVRPAFAARLECTRTEPRAGCMPAMPVTLRFSAPVPRAQALGARLRLAGGEVRAPVPPDGEAARMLEAIVFQPPFPDGSLASLELPAELKDDAGRALENAARFPPSVRFDEYPPLVKFAGDFGILEAGEGGVLPVTLRQVGEAGAGTQAAIQGRRLRVAADPALVAGWLRRLAEATAARGEFVRERSGGMRWREDTGSTSVFTPADGASPFSLAKPGGTQPAEVVGVPLGDRGLHIVELASPRLGRALLGREAIRYVATAALVTNLAVHFKWGREHSLAWVTRLDDARPVAGARVVVSDYCRGVERWQGVTNTDGVATIDVALGEPHDDLGCTPQAPAPLLVSAAAAGDFSFVLSSWDKGIAPHEFGLLPGSGWNAAIFHTVLDRPLYRAGETVAMKHFLRRHVQAGLALPARVPGVRKVVIAHSGSDQRYELQASFDAGGIAVQSWQIPGEARLGEYSISIEEEPGRLRESGHFRVAEFRSPSLRASVEGPARPQVRPHELSFDVHVSYLSGGGASGLPVKLRTAIEERSLPHPGYEDYRFGGGPVPVGVQAGTGDASDWDDGEAAPAAAATMQLLPLTLDAQGAARTTLTDLPVLDGPAQLTAELEYADANGEILTARGRALLVPAALSIGIRPEGWVASSGQMRFRVVVLDLEDRPVAGREVRVSLFSSKNYSYRKRLLGGFYAYETAQENTGLPVRCEGRTDDRGLLLCEVAPGVSGEVLVRAEASDEAGRIAGATTSIWVAGQDDWWFGGTAGDRMDVLPEQQEYRVGQVARFQVRMPFRSATALVTVEREGVLRSFVTRLSGRAPVVKVPIEAADSPNVYVSVLALRGRIASTRSASRSGTDRAVTAFVDLNKPAYRLGAAAIRVGWEPHRLDVHVQPEHASYAVREQARVDIEVRRADGTALPEGAELAVAAVDEALLELAPNESWQLLEAMMGRRGLEVWTSTAQMQVVGKRHYGRKAVPHGGGGGRERARELFDTLLTWQGRVRLDAAGHARVTIPLNDSLSSFRIVAVASAGSQLFGTGSASITTTQDLMLVSGLPPVLREGDRFAATFTVRNASAAPMSVELAASVAPLGALPARRVEVPAGGARDVTWDLTVPAGISALPWEVSARQVHGAAHDRLRVSERVMAVYPVRSYQGALAQITSPLQFPVERPAAALPGRGGLEVSLSAGLGGSLEGVREYMAAYAYSCLEQSLSRAVVLRDTAMWRNAMSRLPAYLDGDGLLRYFPSESLPGEDVLTSHVLAIAHEAGWEIPEASRARLIAALTRFVEGGLVRRSALPTADLSVRKLAAVAALARYGAATPRLLDSITIEPQRWPTSALIDWLGILRRVPGIAQADRQRRAAEEALRARLDFQGTTMTFSTDRGDTLWWLMVSTDANAVRAILELLDRREWRDDLPRLVRGALGRQRRGHWDTTVANAWGTLAMEKFSAAFEAGPVTGVTDMRYGQERESLRWAPAPSTAVRTVLMPWQDGRQALTLRHEGQGAPWATLRSLAAVPLTQPLASGFTIHRSLAPVEQRVAGEWRRGDVMRVRLEIEARSDMSWVVVEDPIPGGATALGSGLGGQSQLLTAGEEREGWVWPAFEERRQDVFRAYYRFVPKGRWVVEYTLRLNNPGQFLLPPTRVEAMYAPKMFGELPNAQLTVSPAP
ncbi:MAG: hypothetical protein IPI06_03830 [Gammaproteobacteria bacterium]|nr:hypothetical protein [Gammaproteobacteria bacterium]